jgi:hypothetical protein
VLVRRREQHGHRLAVNRRYHTVGRGLSKA